MKEIERIGTYTQDIEMQTYSLSMYVIYTGAYVSPDMRGMVQDGTRIKLMAKSLPGKSWRDV